jgi:hypothetical protein
MGLLAEKWTSPPPAGERLDAVATKAAKILVWHLRSPRHPLAIQSTASVKFLVILAAGSSSVGPLYTQPHIYKRLATRR